MPVLGLELLVVDVARDLEIARASEGEASHLTGGAQLGELAGLELAGTPPSKLQVLLRVLEPAPRRVGKSAPRL